MHDDGHFSQEIAARYDDSAREMFSPDMVEPVVEFLLDVRVAAGHWSSGYVWPSELDRMAEMAGMRLTERHAGWRQEPFTSESRQHISVWETIRS